MKLVLATLSITALLTTAALAQTDTPPADQGGDQAPAEQRYSPAFDTCMQGAQASDAAVGCVRTEQGVADQKMAAALAASMAKLNEAQKSRLSTAQTAWSAYRDANCANYADPAFGEGAPVNAAMCVLDMTVDRANELGQFPPQPEPAGGQ